MLCLPDGKIVVGHSGNCSPGTKGQVVVYTQQPSGSWLVKARVSAPLVSNQGLALDGFGNLFCWGMADIMVSGLVVVPDFVRASLEGSNLEKFDLLTGGNLSY